jgi:hypothetical protein
MPNRGGFRNYQQFRREMLNQGPGALSTSVEDIADDMFRVQIGEEDNLFDRIDEDDE